MSSVVTAPTRGRGNTTHVSTTRGTDGHRIIMAGGEGDEGAVRLTPPATLALRNSGMIKSHSSPSLLEVGCFGFRDQDYYSNCTQIVAEARSREMLKDYKGANKLLKHAVEVLISGVQHDPDPCRREGVRRRTAEYLQIAENLAAKYTQQKLSRRPTIISVEDVRQYRVLSVDRKCVIVASPKCNTVRVMKVIRKPLDSGVSAQGLIVRCPYMVNLERCCVSDDVVFLLLQKINGQPLPKYLTRFNKVEPLPQSLAKAEEGGSEALTGNTPINNNRLTRSRLPANLIKKWATQIVACLSSLHRQGLVYGDLNSRNLLVDEFSNLSLTYITQLPGLHHRADRNAIHQMFVAPEVLTGMHAVSPAADWWSFGAILFYLYYGNPVSYFFPYQAFRSGSFKLLPNTNDTELQSLITGLLKFTARERLGAGCMGPEEIRSHPYFIGVNWDHLSKAS